MINVGAFLAPLVVSILKGFSWRYVFLASSAYVALMFLPTIFLYEDPPLPENRKTIRDVAHGAAMVLGDARFMLMIVVYSLFWILYFQNFGSVLWFLRDFIDPAPMNAVFASLGLPFKFDAEFVTVINAGTIILLQVFVSRIVKDLKPLPTMLGGVAIGALGFLCLAFAQNVWLFITGIAVFSIGEMTAHPKYYSYVGLVAPQDKKAVYMGYAFLYGVFGSLIGSSLGGELYGAWLKPLAGTPEGIVASRNFWLLFVLLDVFAVVGPLLLQPRVRPRHAGGEREGAGDHDRPLQPLRRRRRLLPLEGALRRGGDLVQDARPGPHPDAPRRGRGPDQPEPDDGKVVGGAVAKGSFARAPCPDRTATWSSPSARAGASSSSRR